MRPWSNGMPPSGARGEPPTMGWGSPLQLTRHHARGGGGVRSRRPSPPHRSPAHASGPDASHAGATAAGSKSLAPPLVRTPTSATHAGSAGGVAPGEVDEPP